VDGGRVFEHVRCLRGLDGLPVTSVVTGVTESQPPRRIADSLDVSQHSLLPAAQPGLYIGICSFSIQSLLTLFFMSAVASRAAPPGDEALQQLYKEVWASFADENGPSTPSPNSPADNSSDDLYSPYEEDFRSRSNSAGTEILA
jgi:hypothetical protein